MKRTVTTSDIVVLVDEKLRKIIVDTSGKTDKIRGIGVIDPKTLVGTEYGTKIQIGNKQFWVLIPSLQDKLQGIRRQAQIILPRDAAHILINCSIQPGKRVLKPAFGGTCRAHVRVVFREPHLVKDWASITAERNESRQLQVFCGSGI